ncbi:hypothetical protein KIW84_051017 [Lathyrus oleraceus]|uniref:Uncharacterized protein n=1 Tax=Pisum sativum TaxID=3888 RepID=A0A9D5AD97_PEA|nr:hypothetical protein KIW84_051016 [Pisum sativum]KAI5403687.1 hypothetical protein KIW84_051017 [Pisum sativum]
MARAPSSNRAPKSPEQKKKIAQAIAAEWADPDYRERVVSALAKYHLSAEKKPRAMADFTEFIHMPIGMVQRSTQEEASDLFAVILRKQHKKDIAQEAVKKRRRATKKPYSRSIVGAILEVIQKKRAEKPEVRDAAREAALREIKERIKKTKDEKKAKKTEMPNRHNIQLTPLTGIPSKPYSIETN